MENNQLTDRELELLRLVAQGKSNKEIATDLFISINTVKVHLANIFQKLKVSSRTELALYAIEQGLTKHPNAGSSQKLSVDELSRSEFPEPAIPETRAKPINWLLKRLWIVGILIIAIGFTAWALPKEQRKPTAEPGQIVINIEQDRWSELAPMPTTRANMAVVTNNNQIYVIGGETPEGITGLTEVYNIASNAWSRLPDKPTPVTDASAVAIGGKIYVPGGRGATNECLNIVEVYDPVIEQWSKLAAMPYGVQKYAIEVYEGKLFIFGGQTQSTGSQKVVSFNPTSDIWQEEATMSVPRKSFSAVRLSTKILLFGGRDGERTVDEIEAFDPNQSSESPGVWSNFGMLNDQCVTGDPVVLLDTLYWSCEDSIWRYIPQSSLWERVYIGNPDVNFSNLNGITHSDTTVYYFPEGNNSSIYNSRLFSARLIYLISLPALVKP